MAIPSAPVPRLPGWRFLIAGDFTPGSNSKGPYTLESKSLEDLFGAFKPAVSLSIPVDEAEKKSVQIQQPLTSMKDFDPQRFAVKIPITRTMIELRLLLQRLQRGDIDIESLNMAIKDHALPDHTRSAIQKIIAASPSKKSATSKYASDKSEQSGMLDSISSMLDLGSAQSSTCSSGVDEDTSDSNPLTEAIAMLDRNIRSQLETCLFDNDLLELENNWRALKLITDNTDMRSGISLEVAACGREDLVSFLKNQVFEKAWQDNKPPVDAVFLLHPFSRSPADISDLSELSQMSQAVQVPIIGWAGPSFFGVQTWEQVDVAMPSFQTALSGTGYEKFRSFRQKPQAQWLALSTNALFGCKKSRDASQLFQSLVGVPNQISDRQTQRRADLHSDAVMPHIAASAAVLSVISRILCLIGKNDYHDNSIRELPDLSSGNNETASACVWNDDKQWELADAGLLPLSGSKSITGVRFGAVNTCAQEGGSLIQVLISGHLSRLVLSIIHKYGGAQPEELAAVIRAGLREFFGIRYSQTSNDSVRVSVDGANGTNRYHISCESPVTVLGEEIGFELEFEL